MLDPTFHDRVRGLIPTLLALATACASSGPEPADPARLDEAGAFDLDGAAFVIQSGGLDELLSDPRDAGLRRAFALLDERLLELPAELGGGAPPPGTIEFLCDALSSPWTLRVDLDGEGPIPIRAQWICRSGSERAAALAGRFAGLVALTGMPSLPTDAFPGLIEVETPAGSLFHGTTEGGSAFLLAWGQPHGHSGELGATGLPDGVRPALALGIDYGAFLELVGRVAATDDGEEDPEAEKLGQMLELLGLTGDASLGLTLAVGHGTERVHIVSRYANWTPMIEHMGGLAAGSIPRQALDLVPSDASVVSISSLEPGMYRRMLDLIDEDTDALAQIQAALGIELGADLLEPLGHTFGFYLSDTTGGGDLTSAVIFAAVDDEARLESTLDALATRLNELALSEAGGRVRVRSFEHEGTRALELDFPGLPVPLSPSLAISGGHLFLAASPQALAAALDQAGGRARKAGRDSSSWLERLSSERVGSLDDLQALFYVDSPRLARSGYGLASLVAAAFANGVRSRVDLGRDPGPVLPPFAELLANVEPSVMVSRVRGQDLVSVGSCDRSALVHLAATLGWAPTVMTGAVLVGTLVALVAPDEIDEIDRIDELEDPDVLEAEADIWSLIDALDGWASENQGRYPDTLEALLEPDEEGLAWLAEIPLDPWGNPYVYELDGELARVKSYGADGVPGGEGADRDIDSDELWTDELTDEPWVDEAWEEDEEWTEESEPEEDEGAEDEEMEDG